MAWLAYRADMRIKTIDFGKRVRNHYLYLANTVELGKIFAQPHTIVKQICFPNGDVLFLSLSSLSKNWMHNVGWGCAETFPKVVIKKETFTANHGSFPQDFHKEFSRHEVFHKVQRSSVWKHELIF